MSNESYKQESNNYFRFDGKKRKKSIDHLRKISTFAIKQQIGSLHLKMTDEMTKYNLGFISDEDIFRHVKKTVEQYESFIDLSMFNKCIVDPIKLTFDSKIYGTSDKETIDTECLRQMDKHNQNQIGYFHQNIFKYAGNGWNVPDSGFDVVNEKLKIYVEIKNKHNTMNARSAKATMVQMLNKTSIDPSATCMLVEVIAKRSQNIAWKVSFDGEHIENERIRRVSMDKFYEIVFHDKLAFYKMCKSLPIILDDVLDDNQKLKMENTVHAELLDSTGTSKNLLKALYLLAFKTYEGFDNF